MQKFILLSFVFFENVMTVSRWFSQQKSQNKCNEADGQRNWYACSLAYVLTYIKSTEINSFNDTQENFTLKKTHLELELARIAVW